MFLVIFSIVLTIVMAIALGIDCDEKNGHLDQECC